MLTYWLPLAAGGVLAIVCGIRLIRGPRRVGRDRN